MNKLIYIIVHTEDRTKFKVLCVPSSVYRDPRYFINYSSQFALCIELVSVWRRIYILVSSVWRRIYILVSSVWRRIYILVSFSLAENIY